MRPTLMAAACGISSLSLLATSSPTLARNNEPHADGTWGGGDKHCCGEDRIRGGEYVYRRGVLTYQDVFQSQLNWARDPSTGTSRATFGNGSGFRDINDAGRMSGPV